MKKTKQKISALYHSTIIALKPLNQSFDTFCSFSTLIKLLFSSNFLQNMTVILSFPPMKIILCLKCFELLKSVPLQPHFVLYCAYLALSLTSAYTWWAFLLDSSALALYTLWRDLMEKGVHNHITDILQYRVTCSVVFISCCQGTVAS